MIPTTIPADTWLGYLAETTDPSSGLAKKKLVSGPCFNIEFAGEYKDEDLENFNFTFSEVVVAELVRAVNVMVGTDVIIWPEGIREDGSNIVISSNGKEDYTILAFIDGDQLETPLSLTCLDENSEKKQVTKMVFRLNPKFEWFVDNDKSTFLYFITDPETSHNLSNDKVVSGRIKEGFPRFKFWELDLEKQPELHALDTTTEIADITKVALCKYINKVCPKFIHSDMVRNVKHVGSHIKDGQVYLIASIELFGSLYVIDVEYQPHFNFNSKEEESNETE